MHTHRIMACTFVLLACDDPGRAPVEAPVDPTCGEEIATFAACGGELSGSWSLSSACGEVLGADAQWEMTAEPVGTVTFAPTTGGVTMAFDVRGGAKETRLSYDIYSEPSFGPCDGTCTREADWCNDCIERRGLDTVNLTLSYRYDGPASIALEDAPFGLDLFDISMSGLDFCVSGKTLALRDHEHRTMLRLTRP